MNTVIVIAGVVLLAIGAIALGLKFFDTSVQEQEDEKGWED